ncbi:MAG: OmpA family protein [Flavobacteriales bacterium]|nr:OmpA family protein [Flavobacteriales bacterium]
MKNIILYLFALCFCAMVNAQDFEVIKFDNDPENLGPQVNSQFSETSPKISPDGKTLFVTRHTDSNNGKNNIWYSQLNPDGTWTEAKNIGTPLNVQGSATSVQSISPDGNTILLSNLYRYFDGSIAGGGCSVSWRQRGGWAFPKSQVIEKYQNLNSTVNYFLSNSGQFLLMAIEMKKGLGEKDIWVSFKDEKENEWTKPLNLGSVVNTKGDEFAPFLAADDKTLYYASDGHKGYGGADIWMTKRLDDTWENWSTPINLGEKINTPEFDAYFSIDAGGEYAYFSSSKSGEGKSDVFRIKMPQEAKPDPVVLVYGKVFDKKTGQPITANINYELLPSGKEVGTAVTSPEDNIYKIVLPYGNNYGFMASADNYYSITENIDLKNLTEYKEIEVNLYLAPIEKNEAIRLNNIFFEFGESTLKEESFPELNRLIKLLTDNPTLNIEIAGHTDNVGSDSDNLELSKNRAASVVAYLTKGGVKANRLTSQGFGETKPIATNDTDEGKQLNRRVEFMVTSK